MQCRLMWSWRTECSSEEAYIRRVGGPCYQLLAHGKNIMIYSITSYEQLVQCVFKNSVSEKIMWHTVLSIILWQLSVRIPTEHILLKVKMFCFFHNEFALSSYQLNCNIKLNFTGMKCYKHPLGQRAEAAVSCKLWNRARYKVWGFENHLRK